MAYTVKKLAQGAAIVDVVNPTLVYTTPAATTTIIKELMIINTGVVGLYVDIYFGGNTIASEVFGGLPVGVGETKIISLSTVLNAADSIYILPSSTGVINYLISGVQIA